MFFFLDYEGFRQITARSMSTRCPRRTRSTASGSPGQESDYRHRLSCRHADPVRRNQSAVGPDRRRFHQITASCPSRARHHRSHSDDYAKEDPFSDYSDKGDLRLDYAARPSAWFLRVSDRKETGINYPAIPLPLEGTGRRQSRILDQQVPLAIRALSAPTRYSICAWDSHGPRPESRL